MLIFEVKFRIWLEKDGEFLMGKGGAEILRAIEKHGSMVKAAEELGMSYRYVWGYVKDLEKRLGERVVESQRGGEERGSRLTRLGKLLLKFYENAEKSFEKEAEKLKTFFVENL